MQIHRKTIGPGKALRLLNTLFALAIWVRIVGVHGLWFRVHIDMAGRAQNWVRARVHIRACQTRGESTKPAVTGISPIERL